MRGFGDEQFATVTFPNFSHERPQGHKPRIIFRKRYFFFSDLPLVRPVVVDADDIQMLAAAAQFREDAPAKHVPRFDTTCSL